MIQSVRIDDSKKVVNMKDMVRKGMYEIILTFNIKGKIGNENTCITETQSNQHFNCIR